MTNHVGLNQVTPYVFFSFSKLGFTWIHIKIWKIQYFNHTIPSLPLLYLNCYSIQSISLHLFTLCYWSLSFLGSPLPSSSTRTHPSFPSVCHFSALICRCLLVLLYLPLPLCDTLHLLTFQLSCFQSLSVSLFLIPWHSLRKRIWHRVEQLSEKLT